MVKEENTSSSIEVVIVVEATSNMVSHWDLLKKQYILPAVNHFHQQTNTSDELFTSANGNRYGLVLFHAADVVPQSLSQCFPPTRNVHTFIKTLDAIKFGGGGGEQYSHINEGLATALQLFNEFSATQSDPQVTKLCFVVSNTPPYHLPCVESFEYAGLTLNQITDKLSENGVSISVISPRNIVELQQVFLRGNSNQPSLMNYAQDRRHLVLISGFRLPTEREPVPVTEIVPESIVSVKKEDTMMEVSSPVVDGSSDIQINQPEAPVIPNTSVPTESPQFNTSSMQPITVSDTMTKTSAVATQNIQPQQISQTPSSMMQPMLTTAATSSVTNPVRNIASGDSLSQISSQPSFQSVVPQPSINTTFPSTSGNTDAIPSSTADSPYAAAKKEAQRVVQIAQKGSAPKIIWNGALEWKQTRRQPGTVQGQAVPRIVHTVRCQIIQQQNNPTPEIDTNGWPQKLMVQFIPQSFLSHQAVHMQLQPRLYRTVNFNLSPPNFAQQLMMQLQKNVVGFITITNTQKPTEMKDVILMFFKNKDNKKQFIGLIPPDPNALMTAIKASISAVRERSQNQTAASETGTVHSMNTMTPATSSNLEIQGQSSALPGTTNQQLSMQPSFNRVQPQQQKPNPGSIQFQQPRPQYHVQQNIPQGLQMSMANPVSRLNQQGHRMPGMTISPTQQNQQQRITVRQKGILMRNHMQDPSMLAGGTRNTVSATLPNQISGNLPPGNAGTSMMTNQRVMPPGSGGLNTPSKPNVVRMQMHNMRSINMGGGGGMHEQTQLRHLLRNDNTQQGGGLNIRTGDNTAMQQPAQSNLPVQQQQTYMQRPNLMPGMQNNQNNQRRY
ncbi:mediator of RNA polymerase II transcription subunit 25-like [Ciona intestinalis]